MSAQKSSTQARESEPSPYMKKLEPRFPSFPKDVQVIKEWAKAIAGVSDPLGGRSPSGVIFPEGSLPMELLSPNLGSSTWLK